MLDGPSAGDDGEEATPEDVQCAAGVRGGHVVGGGRGRRASCRKGRIGVYQRN